MDDHEAALAVAGLLAIGGAVGDAVAIAPTVPAPIKWQGGWELVLINVPGHAPVYTVPASVNLMVTDLTFSNSGSSLAFVGLYTGTTGTCDVPAKHRLQFLVVPPVSTVHLPYETGIGFGSGQTVCVSANSTAIRIFTRGYLFTAAPAS